MTISKLALRPYFLGLALILGAMAAPARAQIGVGGFVRQIGGVRISTDGVVVAPAADDVRLQRASYEAALSKLSVDCNAPLGLRMVSLKAVEQALRDLGAKSTLELPPDIRVMAGIQRIQFIFIYPEQGDIVLAGPGEGVRVNDQGDAVGVSTGRPVVRLDDLLVAFRCVDQARQGGLSVSIDPSAEGRKKLDALLRSQKTFDPAVIPAIEKSLGPQIISLQNLPETSRLANILVGADWKMKRIAMGLEKSPLKELPSFLEMLKSSNAKVENMMPRWWIACNYEPIAKDPDGLAWEIRGQGAKVMTEEDAIAADGTAKGTGKVNPIAQKWADAMTRHYEELCDKEPIFGELRNAMDLCVVAALITKENLSAKANCTLSQLSTTSSDSASAEQWVTPKSVSTQSSFIKRGKDFIITASGGVSIESWAIADKTQVDEKLAGPRSKAAGDSKSGVWWKTPANR